MVYIAFCKALDRFGAVKLWRPEDVFTYPESEGLDFARSDIEAFSLEKRKFCTIFHFPDIKPAAEYNEGKRIT